jgi:hypothetical protein
MFLDIYPAIVSLFVCQSTTLSGEILRHWHAHSSQDHFQDSVTNDSRILNGPRAVCKLEDVDNRIIRPRLLPVSRTVSSAAMLHCDRQDF